MNTTTMTAFWEGFTTNTIAMINANENLITQTFIVAFIVLVAILIFKTLVRVGKMGAGRNR